MLYHKTLSDKHKKQRQIATANGTARGFSDEAPFLFRSDLCIRRRKHMSQDQLENEIYYYLSLGILNKMAAQGLITKEEFRKIDSLNRHCFQPELAGILQ